jgi:murein DD-endopeptidase MepM/ murein hydrolase activator NlpD
MPDHSSQKRSVLIVSSGGKPVRSVRIGFFTVFFPVALVVCGIAAFFVPPEVFRLKSTEENQKKELHARNEVLYRKFFSALQVLSHLKEQVVRLDARKDKVAALTGIEAGVDKPDGRPAASEGNVEQDPAALLAHVAGRESGVTAFAARGADKKNPFEYIPVCKPVQADASISARFGKVRDPFTGETKPHLGVDLAAPPGTAVVATASGSVVRIGNDEVWGKRITVDHGGGITTVYAHLGGVKTALGRRVKRGDAIGVIGSSGLTTGPHVHYEIWKNGTAIDPETCFFPASQ